MSNLVEVEATGFIQRFTIVSLSRLRSSSAVENQRRQKKKYCRLENGSKICRAKYFKLYLKYFFFQKSILKMSETSYICYSDINKKKLNKKSCEIAIFNPN